MDSFKQIANEDDVEAFKLYLKKTELSQILNNIENDFLLIHLLVSDAFCCALELLQHLHKLSKTPQNRTKILLALRRRNTSSIGPSDVLGNKYMVDPNHELVLACLHTLLFDFLIDAPYKYKGRDQYCSLLGYFLGNNLEVANFLLTVCTKESKITINDLLVLYNTRSLSCQPNFIKKWINDLLENYLKTNSKLFEESLLGIVQFMNKRVTDMGEEDLLFAWDNESNSTNNRVHESLEEQIVLEWASKPNMLFLTKIFVGTVFSKEVAEKVYRNYFQSIEALEAKPQPQLKIQTDLIPQILYHMSPDAAASFGRTCTKLRKLVCGEQYQQYWKEYMEYYWPGSTYHEPQVWWVRCLALYRKDPRPLSPLFPDTVTCELVFPDGKEEIKLRHKTQKVVLTITPYSFELREEQTDTVTGGICKQGTGMTSHALIFIPQQKYVDIVRRDRNSRPTSYTEDIYRGWILKKKEGFSLELYGLDKEPSIFEFISPSDVLEVAQMLKVAEYPVGPIPHKPSPSKKDKCIIS